MMSDTTTQFTVPAVAKAVAAAIPDRHLVIRGEQRYSYGQIIERSNRLAAYLHSRGLGCHSERSALAGHEVGQDLLGLYAYTGNEFVEALLGTFQARVAPFNVNFRYVKNELEYLLTDSGATALIYHAAFAPRVAEILPDLPQLSVLIQIADDSGNDLLRRRSGLRERRRNQFAYAAAGAAFTR
jgi:3-oxocholest-4-en-26-oate---CoA ligase